MKKTARLTARESQTLLQVLGNVADEFERSLRTDGHREEWKSWGEEVIALHANLCDQLFPKD